MQKQVVLITGASSGIGKETALFLMKKGHLVYGTSRGAKVGLHIEHDETAIESGGFLQMIPLDVTNDTSVEAAVSGVLAREGRIDILICNAGIGIAGSIEDTSIEAAQSQFETNYFGSLRVIKNILPTMRQQRSGKIIVISSVAGFISIPYQAHYSASKFALEALIEALRHEISAFGITACLIEPGDTKTGFTANRKLPSISDKDSVYYERFTNSLARMEHDEQNGVSPESVAKLIYRIIKLKSPPVSIAVGFQYKVVKFLKRILPTRVLEKVISLLYN